MKTIIAPSILSCDFLNIESELSAFKNVKDAWVHLDIMDGHFVPNLTFGIPVVKQIAKKCSLPLDAHLMVENPAFHIEEMKDFGIHNITFHYEVDTDCLEVITEAKKYYPSVGISLKPNTAVSSLSDEVLKEIDLLLVMSVEPGFGGQSFIEETYDKLVEVQNIKKYQKLDFMVQVDGGVSNDNAAKLIEHGVDNLVAGSYVFKEGRESYIEKVNSLRS